jgi:hypothetical protein
MTPGERLPRSLGVINFETIEVGLTADRFLR